MAEIKTSVEKQRDLTIHIVSGELLVQEIMDKLQSYYQGEITSLILWDLTKASWSGLSSEELWKFVIKSKKYSRKGGKTALLLSRYEDFGVGKMLVSFSEVEGFDFVLKSFRNRSDAESWLFHGIE